MYVYIHMHCACLYVSTLCACVYIHMYTYRYTQNRPMQMREPVVFRWICICVYISGRVYLTVVHVDGRGSRHVFVEIRTCLSAAQKCVTTF